MLIISNLCWCQHIRQERHQRSLLRCGIYINSVWCGLMSGSSLLRNDPLHGCGRQYFHTPDHVVEASCGRHVELSMSGSSRSCHSHCSTHVLSCLCVTVLDKSRCRSSQRLHCDYTSLQYDWCAAVELGFELHVVTCYQWRVFALQEGRRFFMPSRCPAENENGAWVDHCVPRW